MTSHKTKTFAQYKGFVLPANNTEGSSYKSNHTFILEDITQQKTPLDQRKCKIRFDMKITGFVWARENVIPLQIATH